MPAIFCTTEAAIVVLPCAVSSARRTGEPTVAVGAVPVDVDADDPDPDSEVGLLIPGFSRRRAGLHQVQQRGEPPADAPVKGASAASIAAPTSTAVCSSAPGGTGSCARSRPAGPANAAAAQSKSSHRSPGCLGLSGPTRTLGPGR